MDWNRFRFECQPILDHNRLLNLLVQIEGPRQAGSNHILPRNWQVQLNRLNRIRAVRGTTALEGNPLSKEQVARAMEGESGAEAAAVEWLQVRNAGKAHAWVGSRFGPGQRPLAMQDILYMHSLLTAGSYERNNIPGRLRNHDVQVGAPALGGVHMGAPHSMVPGLLSAFVEFVNSDRVCNEHPVVRALLAHFFLVTIHPFGDGNGRVSRLVEAAVLHEAGYSVHGFDGLSNFFYRHGDEYRTLLQKCRQKVPFDVRPFIEFGLAGFASELRYINSFFTIKFNRLVYLDMMTRALEIRTGKRRRLLNRREFDLLRFLLEETDPGDPLLVEASQLIHLAKLTASPFVRAVYGRVTHRTFIRELKRLADNGFIDFGYDPEADDYAVAVDFEAIGRY